MLFYDPLFLFIFFPVFFTIYRVARSFSRGALTWIALSSVGFYLWSEPRFFFIAFASTIFDYWLGHQIVRKSRSLWALQIGIISNILILVVFKYLSFFVNDVANPTLSWMHLSALPIPEVVLPVGISFIVFEKITYLVDIHRGISPPADTFNKYLMYVFFFPKLLAGPIIKYHEIEPQIRSYLKLDILLFAAGFERFAIGVCKKILIADPVSVIVDQVFAAPLTQLGTIDAWVGAFFFTIQIYFDFSGYSDMAIGLAMMLGFKLRENFNFPYISIGITEFWRRWHISLSSWIREYLYIPLGGSRISTTRTYFNLVIAFMASGLWHGANWTFIVWGAYHGLFLVAERAFFGRWLRAIPPLVGICLTFFVVLNGWVLFRAENLQHAVSIFTKMYTFENTERWIYIPFSTAFISSFALIVSLCYREWMNERLMGILEVPAYRLILRLLLAPLFLYALGKVITQPFQPFLYFRF